MVLEICLLIIQTAILKNVCWVTFIQTGVGY